jgi:hypothetical protein
MTSKTKEMLNSMLLGGEIKQIKDISYGLGMCENFISIRSLTYQGHMLPFDSF